MSTMNSDRGELRGDAFRRALLHSANMDGPSPESTKQAWEKLSAAISGAAVVGSAVGVGGTAGKVAALGVKRALMWLFAGALAGSVATAAWLQTRPFLVVTVPGPTMVLAVPQEVPQVHSEDARPMNPAEVSSPPASGSTATPKLSIVAPKQTPVVEVSAPAADTQSPDVEKAPAPPSSTASSLAGEIAALDKGLSALSNGRPEDALECVRQYRVAFPEGALARDADVVGIEALAAKKDRAELERATAKFLTAFPKDPHASRVRWLADHFHSD